MTIELEETLLKDRKISKQIIRNEIVFEKNDSYDESIDNEVNDQYNKFLEIAKLFGQEVFVVDEYNSIITFNKDCKSEKEHLLCIACMKNNNMTEKKRKKISSLFEKVVGEVVRNYLGYEKSEMILVGKEQGISFKEVCEKISEEYKREFNDLEGDGHCDLLVWKEIDNRPGKIIFLVQCKSGKNWDKGNPVVIKSWENAIEFTLPPLRIYAITDLLKENNIIHIKSSEKGLIFDRARIIRLSANLNSASIRNLRKEIQENLIN